MKDFEGFCKLNSVDGGFLQSEYWENFYTDLNIETSRAKNPKCFNALAVIYRLPLVNNYFFIPRGPIIGSKILGVNSNELSEVQKSLSNLERKQLKECFTELIFTAIRLGTSWIRIEPQNERDLEIIKNVIGGEYDVVKSKKNHEPAQTLMLDLKKSEEEILNAMKSKTRYNIRLSQKKGVKVFNSKDENYIDKFYELVQETAKRDKIAIHSREHYKMMIKSIPDNFLKLYLAEYEGEIIGATIISFFGDVATYLHGASSDKYRNVMANYFLQWEMIREAKKRGCKKYDFGGIKIAQKDDKNCDTRWDGITRFKLGFCPQDGVVNFPGCWDIVLRPQKYRLYRRVQKIKDLLKFY